MLQVLLIDLLLLNANVLELIPYFGKLPQSYAIYPLIQDAYISFDIEISIKPESPDGNTDT